MAKLKHDNILSGDIVLFQILPRLPARSIGRFMSVSKQWHSFLTSPMFTKMHLHYVNNQNHPKILAVPATNPCNYFRTFDCETPEVGLSAAKRPLPFETDRKMQIISSLNGLLCVAIDYSCLASMLPADSRRFSDIILWNPLTGDYKTLSKDNSLGNCVSVDAKGYGSYYSSCDDDYKLLCVTESNDTYIYSWKSGSWRKAKSRVDSLIRYWHSSCLLNGKLYFVSQGFQGRDSVWSCSIIRFDTNTEMFTEIATPSSSTLCFNLTVVGGCVHLSTFTKIDSDKLVWWKMDGDGEWTKVIRFSTLQLLSKSCHIMKNGNWLHYSYREVFVNKSDRKEAKEVSKYTIDNTMILLTNGKFLETIVSLKPK